MTPNPTAGARRRHTWIARRLAPIAILFAVLGASAAAAAPLHTLDLAVSSVSPTAGQTVSGSIVWKASATRASRVDFKIDGVRKASDYSSPYVFNGATGLDTTTLSNGNHTLTVTAIGGGLSKSASITVKVSNTVVVPLAVVTSAPVSGTVSGKIPWQATVTSGTAARVSFLVDGVAKWNQATAPYSFNGSGGTLDTTTLSNGSHRLAAVAYSSTGASVTSTVAVTVSNQLAVAPSVTALPTVTGSTVVGSALAASTGTWNGTPTGYAYQWQRCDTTGAACVAIATATTAAYTATSSDQGSTLRVQVTATNAAGSVAATSSPTATITSQAVVPPQPVLFNGGFESGWTPWNSPQCANYGYTPTTRVFGNFYAVTDIVGAGTTAGRFDLPADSTYLTRCQVITPRPVNTGNDDYYSLMFYLPNGWTTGTSGFWGVEIAQLNLQNLGPGGPTIALRAFPDHVTLVMQTGIASATSKPAYQYGSNADVVGNPYINLPGLYAVPPGMQLGVWHELIIHAHWAADSTGQIDAWHRVKGQSTWTKTASLSGYPTLQTNPDGSIPTNSLDMIGAYRAQSTAPVSVWLDGFTRSQSFATAASNLP